MVAPAANLLKHLFTAFCMFCAVSMIGYWIYKFGVEDRDIGVVDYVSIENTLDIELPVASVCFARPFMSDGLRKYGLENNDGDYLDYLKGDRIYDSNEDTSKLVESSEKVDYKNATLDLDEFLLYGFLKLRNETRLRSKITDGLDEKNFKSKENFNGLSQDGIFEKCFEITSAQSSHYFDKIVVGYDLEGIRQALSEVYFSVVLHYPGQYLLKVTLPDEIDHMSYDRHLFINIEDIEVIKSRNSQNRNCTPYNQRHSFDDMVREAHIAFQGCRPPYLRPFKNFSSCKREKMKASLYDYETVKNKYYPECCQRLSKIVYEVEPYRDVYSNVGTATWELTIRYPNQFRIIIQSKEVDIHALIGNIGGYIGLFLGSIIDPRCH